MCVSWPELGVCPREEETTYLRLAALGPKLKQTNQSNTTTGNRVAQRPPRINPITSRDQQPHTLFRRRHRSLASSLLLLSTSGSQVVLAQTCPA